jgi:hypothetical protein
VQEFKFYILLYIGGIIKWRKQERRKLRREEKRKQEQKEIGGRKEGRQTKNDLKKNKERV